MVEESNYWYNIANTKVNENVPTDFTFSKWTKLNDDSEIAEKAKAVIADSKVRMSFDGVVESISEHEKTCYIAAYSGGMNGGPIEGSDKNKWSEYLDVIKAIVDGLDGWILSLENDACDDIWYLTVGFSK